MNKAELFNDALGKACDQISQTPLGLGFVHYGVNWPVTNGEAQVRVYSREYNGALPAACQIQDPYYIPRDVCVNAFNLMVEGWYVATLILLSKVVILTVHAVLSAGMTRPVPEVLGQWINAFLGPWTRMDFSDGEDAMPY